MAGDGELVRASLWFRSSITPTERKGMNQIMKRLFQTSVGIVVGITLSAGGLTANAAGFSEDFESGLGQWTGKYGGSHSGIIVADPLSSGHGSVLTFSDVTYGGDIFTADPILFSGSTVVRFDYLGLTTPCDTADDSGGFLGTTLTLNPVNEGEDHIWYAATRNNYPGLAVLLADDGAWHRYQICIEGESFGSFRLMMEDFIFSGGGPGDVYFDNISVISLSNPVPEPAAASLAIIGALAAALRRRQCSR